MPFLSVFLLPEGMRFVDAALGMICCVRTGGPLSQGNTYSECMKKAQTEVWAFQNSGAGDESRTRDLNLGKVALYQLSYSRVSGLAQFAMRSHQRR